MLHQACTFRVVFCLVILAVFLGSINAGSNTASELPVTVKVYNAVDLSSGELSRAEQKAGNVFQAAGITLLWANGLLVRDLSDKTPIGVRDRASLQLRLWRRAMAGNRPTSAETLGFCLSLENGDAVVLADTIRDRAVFGPSNFADLFGLAMAHELGHLLLRSAAHSVTGIMRRQWTEKRGTQPRPKITVRVFDYAGIPPEAMARAEREVNRIFRKTGIQAGWLNCPLSPATTQNAASCPGSWLWTDLLLRVIPRATADRSNNSLGFSLPSSDSGIVAVIFYDRVEELTKASVAGAGQILGQAVAHEIGHLLLGSIIHSSTGIMSSPWSREDVRLARLLFTRQEGKALRLEVIRRMHLPPRAESTQPVTASELRVIVNVYNGISLSSSELSRAEREAEKIFLYAGIQLTWTTGFMSAAVNDSTPSERWNAASLQLRIWPRAMAGKRPTSSETLGFCLSLENGDAVVLADAIQKRAVFGTTNFANLLGLAMAHELGHLLLRSAAHSVAGIMRAQWTEKGLSDDDRGYLRFTPGEAESMRSEVRRRMGLKSAC